MYIYRLSCKLSSIITDRNSEFILSRLSNVVCPPPQFLYL